MEAFGTPVLVLPKERYRYRPRTDECFHFQFAFLSGTVAYPSGAVIPDQYGCTTREVWIKYDQR